MRSLFLLAALAASPAFAAPSCTIDLAADDQMKFDKTEIAVSAACAKITINLRHVGKLPATAMGHNVVISPTADFQAAAQDGLAAGPASGYVKPGDARVIAATPVIGGGETTTAEFPGAKLTAGSAYTFYCSFPGHWALMKGTLRVE